MTQESKTALSLLFRANTLLCALPIENVSETMRPLPIERLTGMPGFVCGLSIIRGAPVPVINAASLIGEKESLPSRFILLKIEGRPTALAVDAVLGVRALPAASLQTMPPLLGDAASDVVDAIGTLDAELLLVLRNVHLAPDSVWNNLDPGGC
ncbi:MAG: chemotaxis protein CheW [Acidobacteria bacterium]|nr:chemotaxis protein CheW [Acidobacteriota bacterium]